MKITPPFISIIIPVYNGANYLREAIDSALKQTYKHREIIVVDDGSTDNGQTAKIAKSYGNKIRYFRKKNGHVSSALNYGISKMKGDWFAWLSHDDIYFPNKCKTEVQYISKYPNTMILYSDTLVIDSNNNLVSLPHQIKQRLIHGASWFFKNWIYGCSILINKKCFIETTFFNESNRTCQDVEITLDLLANYEFVHIPEVLVKRRDHIESGMHILQDLNNTEISKLLSRLIMTRSIDYFYPELKRSTLIERSIGYTQLGIHLITVDPKIAQKCFTKSIKLWNSSLNVSKYLSIINVNLIRFAINIFQFLLGSIRGVKNRYNIILQIAKRY